MTDPTKPVEATPETDAVQIDMERSTNPIEYQAQQYRDLARHLERELAEKKHELKQAHGVAQACEERAETAERQLSLAQTEIAGHIRIEDELKAALELAQRAINGALHVANEERARCAGLEKDAARYRWIERNLRVEHANEVYAKHCINVRNEGSLEEAIDAAISAGKP